MFNGESMGDARRLRVAGAVLAIAVLCALFIRIGWVNAHAETMVKEHYAMGEWVDLTGCYFDNIRNEDMEGYSIRIVCAQAVSYSEYVARYAFDKTAEVEMPVNPDAKTVVVLEYEVRNEGNDAGGVALYRHHLIPSRKNVAYTYDSDLWWLAEPKMEDRTGGFALAKDSSYITYVPFTFVSDPPYLQKYDYEIRMEVGDDRLFELILCNAPVQKIVDVELR